MAKVTVYHMVMDRATGQQVVEGRCPMFDAVAEVTVGDGVDVQDALDHAWRYTNNVMGSWSAGPRDFSNEDYSPDVKVLMENHVDEAGKEWGRRSSMVGDVFGVGTRSFEVAMFGFEEVKNG